MITSCISEKSAIIDSDYKDGGENVTVECQSCNNTATFTVCDAAQPQTYPDLFMTQESISCGEAVVSNNAGGIPVDEGGLEREVIIKPFYKITLLLFEIVF